MSSSVGDALNLALVRLQATGRVATWTFVTSEINCAIWGFVDDAFVSASNHYILSCRWGIVPRRLHNWNFSL